MSPSDFAEMFALGFMGPLPLWVGAMIFMNMRAAAKMAVTE